MFNLSLLSSDSYKICLKIRHKKHCNKAVPSRTTMAKTFDGPPTLERSGSEHRRAVTSLIPMVGI